MLGSGGWISVINQRPPLLPLKTQMEFWQPGVKAGVADLGHGETRWYVAFKNYIPSVVESKKRSDFQSYEASSRDDQVLFGMY